MKLASFQGAAITYAIAGLICFGPAAVEEDALEAAKKAECEAHREEVIVHTCKSWARNEFRPLMKSLFWPFWLSYRVTKTVSSPSHRTHRHERQPDHPRRNHLRRPGNTA